MLELLSAVLRNGAFVWPDAKSDEADRLYELAREQGIHILLAERLWQRGELNRAPQPLRDRLVSALRNQMAIEELSRCELHSVLDVLHKEGTAPLLFKGAALAYTHYGAAALRPRADTDLLIADGEVRQATAALERRGYQRAALTSGELVMYQAAFSRTDARGIRHTIDVHWRVSNPQLFARAFTAEELRARATRVPALGNNANAVGPVDALALACIHRVAHHHGEDRLIWLYDIFLVAERMAVAEREAFVDLVRMKQLTAVSVDGLAAAERRFRGVGITSLLARLDRAKTAAPERSAIYVEGRVRKIDVLASDLTSLQGWGARLRLLREHVLPPASYMRQTYGVSTAALLPLFYVWRVARGAAAWFRRSR